MEPWESIAGWCKKTFAEDLFRQSGEFAEDRLVRAQHAWRNFSLIPVDFLKTASGDTDREAFVTMGAFLMYHWDAYQMAGLSLSSALCGQYNAGFTLLRSYLELLLKGSFFQCLAQKKLRKSREEVLEPTDLVSILTSNVPDLIRDSHIDDADLDSNSSLIFDLLRSHWMHDLLRLDLSSIIKQVDGWGMLNGLELEGNRPDRRPSESVRDLYGRLSQNVHERVEYTDSGRAVEEGGEIFEAHAPILKQSLLEFRQEFHKAMEIGVIIVLNQLARRIPEDRLQDKSRQLLNSESFNSADLKSARKLLKRWIAQGPG